MAAGDERALGELYDRHGSTVYALPRAIVGERADTEDVVADAFGQAWRTAGQFDPARGHGEAPRCAQPAEPAGGARTEHRWTELAAPYALGSLDPGERAEFERHLETCASCRVEVQSFREVSGLLARGVAHATPPAELRAR